MGLHRFFVIYTIVSSYLRMECTGQYRHDDDDTIVHQDDVIAHHTDVIGHEKEDVHGTEVTRHIEEMFRVHSYELSIRPSNRGRPVKVQVSLMIESITDISEKNMDLTFTLCIHETWYDERLRFNGDSVESIVLPSRLLQKIWVPDLYIVGSKYSFIHKTTVDNTVLRLYKDGRIFYNVKLTTTVACQMDLYKFPLDTENCSVLLQSLGYTSAEVQLSWNTSGSLFMNDRLVRNMPKFRLLSYQYHEYLVKCAELQNFADGAVEVSQLSINFYFKRYLLSVFFQSYFLGMAMVVLAGLGMWVDPRSVPARVAISVTSVLTLSTIITGLKTSLPKVSYLTAMDIYLWICFLFIFSTVLEFCIFNYIMTKRNIRRLKMIRKSASSSSNGTCDDIKRIPLDTLCDDVDVKQLLNGFRRDINFRQQQKKKEFETTTKKKRRKCSRIEKYELIEIYFRLFYFASFVVFNCIYWNYYIRMTYDDSTF